MRELFVLFQSRPFTGGHWAIIAVHHFIDEDGVRQIDGCAPLTIAVIETEAEAQRITHGLNAAVSNVPLQEFGEIPVGDGDLRHAVHLTIGASSLTALSPTQVARADPGRGYEKSNSTC